VANLLLPEEEKLKWRGMRTLGQIKRDKGIKADVSLDHLYTKVVREPKVFSDLQVPIFWNKYLIWRLDDSSPEEDNAI
jgi:ribosome biogenesis protein BMS1